MRNLQQERRQRGEDFQNEIRDSWKYVPNCWRLRITDTGASRPADELILTEYCNILAEHKRTAGDRFELSFLRTNQVKGLTDFELTMERNFGLVFVSFLNDTVDETYVLHLIAALHYMKCTNKLHITLDELRKQHLPCAAIPFLDKDKRIYDLLEVVRFCRSALGTTFELGGRLLH